MAKLIESKGHRYGRRQSLVLPGEFFTQSVGMGGRLKVWTGAQWALKPVKVWNGSAWVERPVRAFTGGEWR